MKSPRFSAAAVTSALRTPNNFGISSAESLITQFRDIISTVALVMVVLPSTVPLWPVIAGFTVATSVGLFFGIWPAVKASCLDPIAALRYE